MNRSQFTAAAAVASLAIAVAGCGSSKKSNSSTSNSTSTPATSAPATSTPTQTSAGGGGAASSVALAADPGGSLKFNKTSATAKAGAVTLAMTNPSPIQHGIGVKGNGIDKDGQIVSTGGKSTITVNLKPGTYEFYCPVPGHEAAGMKGTLTVQ